MTYRISPKRGGWIVLDLNRKQVNKGILKKKKDAIEYRDSLLNKLSQTEPSKYWFKAEYKKFVDYRMEIASDPTLELTIGGVEGYRSDYNQRIKPYFEDCLLSDFKKKHMVSFLIIFDTIFRPDAGLYHLPFVKILNEEKSYKSNFFWSPASYLLLKKKI